MTAAGGRCERCPRPAAKAFEFSWVGPRDVHYKAVYAACSQACAVELARSECQRPYEAPRFPPGSKLRELIGADAVLVLRRNAASVTGDACNTTTP